MATTSSTSFENFLKKVQDAMDTEGVAFLEGEPSEIASVKGKTFKGEEYDYCLPKIVVDRRATAESPIAIWFTKDEKKKQIRMNYQLLVKPQQEGKQPLLLSNIRLDFYVQDKEGKVNSPKIKIDLVGMSYPQKLSGWVNLSLPEFSYLKNVLDADFLKSESRAYFSWSGDVVWVPIAQMSNYSQIKDSKEREVLHKKKYVEGKIPLSVPNERSIYEGVSSLLCWEHERIESGADRYDIYFKDAFMDDTYYFLPQIFRIKADPHTNAPMMTITFVKDPEVNPNDPLAHKVLFNFELVPYYHPRAERDLYRVMKKRSGGKVKICNIKYGGYESATFNKKISSEYDFLGIKALEDEITLNPDSSFWVVLESSLEGYDLLYRDLAKKSVNVGSVTVSVKTGIDEKIEEIPLVAELDMKKLTGHNIGIKPIASNKRRIKFPYEVELTNNGEFPLEIGGCELSMISEKKQVPRDVMHELKTDTFWPIMLAPKETTRITLCESDVKMLNKKNTFLGINFRKYWTKLVCQPHSVRLPQEYIEAFLSNKLDLAINPIEVRKLEIIPNLDWSQLTDVKSIEIQIRNEKLLVDELVTVDANTTSIFLEICANAIAIINSQNNDNWVFQYKLRVVLTDRTTPWTEFKSCNSQGAPLYLHHKLVEEAINL